MTAGMAEEHDIGSVGGGTIDQAVEDIPVQHLPGRLGQHRRVAIMEEARRGRLVRCCNVNAMNREIRKHPLEHGGILQQAGVSVGRADRHQHVSKHESQPNRGAWGR